jgi:protein SCO1
MAGSPQQFPRIIWFSFGLFLGLLALVYLYSLAEYGETREKALPELGQVANFALTNENGELTTLADLTNHVWVADIIFTRCASSCPIMSSQMKSLQAALPTTSQAKLVTLTCDPAHDTPTVMKKYGEHYDANFNRWTFLTGSKKELSDLATGSLKLGVTPVLPKDQTSPTDFFVHSTLFVVVDKHAHLRGIFQTEGTGVDWPRVQPHLIEAVQQLESEQ